MGEPSGARQRCRSTRQSQGGCAPCVAGRGPGVPVGHSSAPGVESRQLRGAVVPAVVRRVRSGGRFSVATATTVRVRETGIVLCRGAGVCRRAVATRRRTRRSASAGVGVSISSGASRCRLTEAGLWLPATRDSGVAPATLASAAARRVGSDRRERARAAAGYHWAMPVFIEDATPAIPLACLAQAGSPLSYLGAMEECSRRHGIPAAVVCCTGRHTAFVPHARDDARGESRVVGRVFGSGRRAYRVVGAAVA